MKILDLGITGYEEALSVQKNILTERIKNKCPDTLIMVEHEPVVTLGRVSEESSIVDRSFFNAEKIPIIATGRGGKVTYHAPGQLVLYPIIDLSGKKRDVAFYIDLLERFAVKSLIRIGVPAERINGTRGVWLRGKKIAFIGISVKKWVVFHGIAININADLGPFSRLHPCGEKDIRVTSAKEHLGYEPKMDEVKKIFAGRLVRELKDGYDELTGEQSQKL